MKRSLWILLILLSVLLSCSPEMNGRYYPEKKGLVNYIEFRDGKIIISGFVDLAYGYSIRNQTIYVETKDGAFIINIIDPETIESRMPFTEGIYKKR